MAEFENETGRTNENEELQEQDRFISPSDLADMRERKKSLEEALFGIEPDVVTKDGKKLYRIDKIRGILDEYYDTSVLDQYVNTIDFKTLVEKVGLSLDNYHLGPRPNRAHERSVAKENDLSAADNKAMNNNRAMVPGSNR